MVNALVKTSLAIFLYGYLEECYHWACVILSKVGEANLFVGTGDYGI